jgi:hypothetical protein
MQWAREMPEVWFVGDGEAAPPSISSGPALLLMTLLLLLPLMSYATR